MSQDAEITFSDGKLTLPREVQREMHLVEGARLRVVSASPGKLRVEPADKPEPVNGEEPIWLGNRWWIPNDDWRAMQGMLSGHPDHDTSKARHEEREWELEHDERKFGPFPKR